ncbi:MAG: hypothetical protein JWO37_3780 [Acidimicrobiales bacterium]|jgi:hypothetical protein|nr:hypothetical protein [Acidimicrobiales bacterium]
MVDQRPRAGGTRSTARSWFEDPHLSLRGLTPGQRYTAVLVAVLTILVLKIGLPHAASSQAVSQTTVKTARSAADVAATSTTVVHPDVATSPTDPGLVVVTPPLGDPSVMAPVPSLDTTTSIAGPATTAPTTTTTPSSCSTSGLPSPVSSVLCRFP